MRPSEHTRKIIRGLADDISEILDRGIITEEDREKLASDKKALLFALREFEEEMTEKQKALLARAYAEYPTQKYEELQHLADEVTLIFR